MDGSSVPPDVAQASVRAHKLRRIIRTTKNNVGTVYFDRPLTKADIAKVVKIIDMVNETFKMPSGQMEIHGV